MININKNLIQTFNDTSENGNVSYLTSKNKDKKEIKRLISLGYEVKPSVNNHFVIINGKCFNGWTIEQVNKLFKKEDCKND